MISDEERRRVAKALREPSELLNIRVPIYEALDMPPDVAETLVSSEGVEHNNRRLLNRLADLIDRPTCRNLSPKPADVLLCSECGEHVDIAYMETCDEYHAKYCPNCGAEVVE